jgi:hypothetical protein
LESASVKSFAFNSSGDIFAGGACSVFRSTDNGDTWIQINNGLTKTWILAIAINSSDVIFAGTEGGGVFRSIDNGENWTETNIGLVDYEVKALAFNSSDNIFAGTYGGGVFRSTDNGDTWALVHIGMTNYKVRALAINSSGDIFAGTQGGGVFRSTDNGDSWTEINTGLTRTVISDIAINSSDDIFAGTTGGGVFYSTDNGDSWTEINTGLTHTTIFDIAINSSDGIFAGTSGGGVYKLLTQADINVSLDIKPGSCPNPLNMNRNNGKAVLPVAILGTEEFDVQDIDPSTITLLGIQAVRFNYEDVGEPQVNNDDCQCSENGPDGYEDLTLKFDRNTLIDTLLKLPFEEYQELTISGMLHDSTEFSGTDCIRMLKTGRTPQTMVVSDNLIPLNVELVGNNPNPFNPTTFISLGLPTTQKVKLEIYNLLGRKVETLIDGYLEAGYHSVVWNASSNASGVYFYRLSTDDFTETKKMLLLK